MKPIRRHFTREFKLEAVRLVTTGGHSVGQVARDLDINETMLRRWRQEMAADPTAAFPATAGYRRRRSSACGVKMCACARSATF